ncbi:hypothetical protein ACFSQJ_15710 [Croceitalea marina]|uniref:DUF5683 domain-containing protein n=1 Tax=Croceitalea marina TaxID=1775166 RepID=A0ABW5N2E5_9FLAO
MKRIVLLNLIVLFITTTNQAQEQEIEMKVNFWGYRFMKDGERLNWKELEEATTAVENANLLIKKARTQRTLSNVGAFISGGLIGIPLGQESAGREPTWELAYVSGAFFLVSFHLSLKSFNNVNKGVDLYNLTVNKTAQYQFQPELQVVSNKQGLGLALRF